MCFRVRFRFAEQSRCSLRILLLEGSVTYFACQEVHVVLLSGLAVQSELLAAAGGVESEQIPVTGINSQLLFILNLGHTLADTMVDTRSVSDDQGRSGISLCLGDGLDSLVLISAHGDLCYIYIAIAHCHSGQILLNGLLTVGSELSDSAFRSSLGGLSACVGVNFCVEAEYVDILAGSQNVVDTAVADIVCPAVCQ